MLDAGSAQWPFSHYTADEPIVTAGARVQGHVGDIDALLGDVDGSHAPAVAGVDGLLRQPMVQAAHPMRDRTLKWAASAVFAGGAVVRFGGDVLTFNTAVDELNRRYRAAKSADFGVTMPDLPADATAAQTRLADTEHREAVALAGDQLLHQLRTEHDTVHMPALDDAAAQVAGLLDRGPEDGAAVLELYAAGALPFTSPLLFPGVNFASVPPPLGGGQGRDAAEMIERALAGEATPAEFREAMAMLQLVTGHALYVQQHGGTLSEDSLAFLHTFYNTLDERIFDVPDYIRDDDRNWSDDRQNVMLAAMGTGLLALSNTSLYPSWMLQRNPMSTDSRFHLPPSVIDLVSNPAASYGWRGYPHLADLDQYRALAAMLGRTDGDMQGGRQFSVELTLRVAELAHGVPMSPSGWDRDEAWDPVMHRLLEVSTRNPLANHDILTGDFDAPEEGIESSRPFPLSPDRVIEYLYSFEWSDNGTAATGLTAWIPEYAHSDDPGDVRLAGRSAAALIDVVTGTSGRDMSDGRDNMYDHLMDRLGERNPEIVLGLGRVASAYLSDFAGPSPLGMDDTTRWSERSDEVVIVDADKSRFLNLVATNGEAMDRLSYDAGAFTQGNLRAALEAGDPVHEQMAAGTAGTLDGLLHAARMTSVTVSDSQDYEARQREWAEQMYFAGLGKSAFTTGVGVATSNPITNYGVGVLSDAAVSEIFESPGPPGSPSGPPPPDSPADYAHASQSFASYDYVRALVDGGRLSLADVAARSEGLTVRDDAGATVLRDVTELTPDELTAIELLARQNGGSGYIENYEMGDEYDNSVAENVDDADEHRRGGG